MRVKHYSLFDITSSPCLYFSPERYPASLIYRVQQSGAGSIHEVCLSPLPFTIVSRILNTYFGNYFAVSADRPSPYVFFSFFPTVRSQYRGDKGWFPPNSVHSNISSGNNPCQASLSGIAAFFRNMSAAPRLTSKSDAGSYILFLAHDFPRHRFARTFMTIRNSFYSPKYIFRWYRTCVGRFYKRRSYFVGSHAPRRFLTSVSPTSLTFISVHP